MRYTITQMAGRTVHRQMRVLSFVAVLSVGLGTLASLNAQTLTWLGTLPGGNESYANGVSADGTVVVGWATNTSGQRRAFRWVQGQGMQDLGTLGGNESYANGVSADGTVVVGWAQNANGIYRAFRWKQETGMQDLGTFGGTASRAYGVSADGNVVVGGAWNGRWRAFHWENGVIYYPPHPTGWLWSYAYGVSADGSALVGAFRREEGYPDPINGENAFRWTQANGMQELGWNQFSRSWSEAYGVSADGSVVVGWSWNRQALRWTLHGGTEFLSQTYACLLSDLSRLSKAQAISPDGRYIVGYGYNASTRREEAFLLDTACQPHNGDVNCDGCVDDADLLAALFAFGNSDSNLGRVDVNCDTVVDDADLLEVLFNFGSGC